MKEINRKAFTLIELLVVIAIIGLLASIAVVSTRSALTKGKDAQVQGAIIQVRNIGEMIWNDEGKYNNLCTPTGNLLNTSHTTYGSQLTNIANQVSTANGGTAPSCYADTTSYCVSAPLATTGKYFCVDNTGKAATTATNPNCPTNKKCP